MATTLESTLTKASTPLEQEIAGQGPWFHNLHLPDGTQTAPQHPLGDFPAFKWREIESWIPEDLRGWTALDVGCNAGFYSFALARRGADVSAIDLETRYLEQAKWAARLFELENRICFEHLQVYELARRRERFDLVWFMGVFYHLRYPLLALDLLAERTRRLMVFQTLTLPGEEVTEAKENLAIEAREILCSPGWPRMAFVEHSLAGDPTNWWAPNHAGVEAMLRSAGLRVVGRPCHEVYVCEPDADLRNRHRHLVEPQLQAATGSLLA